MDAIAERIRAIRGDTSQIKFGELVGIPQRKLSRLETGAAPLDLDSTQKICIKMNVSADWLLFGKGAMKQEKSEPSQSPELVQVELKKRIAELESQSEGLAWHVKILTQEKEHIWSIRDKDAEHYQKTIDWLMQQIQMLTLQKGGSTTVAPVSAPPAPSISLTSDE